MFSLKKLSIGILLTAVFLLPACSSAQISDILKQVSTNPSTAEISSGIKEALEKGTGISAERLSLENGYLGNLDVKILFPEEAKNVESTLRSLGLGSMCDQVITSLNRAAEDAAIAAKPIFTDAIKQMSFQDVQQILLGEKNAATVYFKGNTTTSLSQKFSPIIDTSLKKVDATKYWSDVMTRYNKVPFVKKVDTDLTAYVTQKAIDGLFVEIAKEELKIRENITARTSPLLQKVFGYAEREKSGK
ncbi:DUF4197 domain-containing protein [Algoriphagus sp.]|jgi:hypothetical protein|uniref:DUF4197 domain-containing protein n=1 Tax=Algoriphagus sp. TaxID=1872435 RepID=UPI00272696A3|nr:DUF4197 domain-containing protein [Algoriphagus sp.]MDO8966857.1 DUF4197 domain-containing protein [Algoriphagus sp.]MDP3199820.1 DUF4197 domain-containing protein [Algoriphagus sp.]